MDREKYENHKELVKDEMSAKILELIEPYPRDVQFLLIADTLTALLSDYLEIAKEKMKGENEDGKYFYLLMNTRLDKISKKFFDKKITEDLLKFDKEIEFVDVEF